MNTQEIFTLAEAIVGAWDWATEVSHPRANQIDVKVTHLNELVPIVVGLRVKRLGYLCAIVGLDLGFRTIALKKDFFTSLGMYDIASLVSEFKVKEARIVPDGDHIYGVLGPDQSMADSVIAKTAAWFVKNL